MAAPEHPDIARRARWLVAGLRADDLADDEAVAVLCCDEHADDGLVARAAVASLGRAVAVIPPDQWSRDPLRAALALSGARLALACSHGTEAWQASGASGRLVGEGPGARWWRLVELGGRRATEAGAALRASGC